MNRTLSRKPDFWFGLVGICLSLSLFAETRGLSAGAVSDSVGAAFFPRLLAGLLLVFCGLLVIRTHKSAQPDVHKSPIALALATIILIACYAVMMPYAGYYPCTAILIAGVLLIAGMRKPASIALVVTALISFQFVVFDTILGVLFPAPSFMDWL